MKKIKGLIILFFLFAPTVVFANGEDETPQNEELTADSLERLHIDLEAANKKIKEKSYAEMSIEKLSELLRKAVENEQYEEASKIKSEIDRRNNE